MAGPTESLHAGNDAMVTRFFKQDALRSIKVTWCFITKSHLRSPAACRKLFFSGQMPDAEAQRWGQPIFGLTCACMCCPA